ncbi:MAG TPA: choice-of-anchor B family protein [Rhodanobacteraceae bacterium]|nr:choice-of-anchor B family protein [Rhodanobacteraceae bacterium]
MHCTSVPARGARVRFARVIALMSALLTANGIAATPDGDPMRALESARPSTPRPMRPQSSVPCVAGMAGGYPCQNVDLLAFVPLSVFSAVSTNSLWGWTDPADGVEYALVGADNGVAFFRLGDPTQPTYLGKLPTHTGSSVWRDVRVYQHYAYVGSDNNPGHGLQVFDLTRLRGQSTPQTFTEDGYYDGFGNSHTLSVNEDTGYLGVAGGDYLCPGDSQAGGFQLFDIHTNPLAPVRVGCVNDAGYTHEAQCFTYHGPDTAHAGRDICINANGNSGVLALIDATDPSAPVTLSHTTYAGSRYTHQAWFSDDHRYILLDDELDEQAFGHNARTYVFDAFELEAPVLAGYHDSDLHVIDHNLYVHGQYVYQSDYEAGFRILRLGNLSAAEMTEVASFDTYPDANDSAFNGNWNNYLFPGSGNVIATGIDEGFFVLQPHLCTAPAAPSLTATPDGDNRIDLAWSIPAPDSLYRVDRAQGGCGGSFQTIADQLSTGSYADTSASGEVNYGYQVTATDPSGFCASPASTCVEAETTGLCTAPPIFAGIASATNAATGQCSVALVWPAAAPACGGPAAYAVYRSPAPDFMPGPGNRIAHDLADLAWSDTTPIGGVQQYYVVRASDEANGAEETNLVRLSALPTGPNVDGTFVSGAEPGEPPFDTGSLEQPGRAPDTVEHAGWHYSTDYHHSGTQSFWSTQANNLCVTLVSPVLTLSASESPDLSFWTIWDIEDGYDGGVLDVSTDNGASWSRLTPVGGYPGTIADGDALCGITPGSGAFTGEGHLDAWTAWHIDLSPFAGQSVRLRWLYRTDYATSRLGWFIDDIAISHAQVPSACLGETIFGDGFDDAP